MLKERNNALSLTDQSETPLKTVIGPKQIQKLKECKSKYLNSTDNPNFAHGLFLSAIIHSLENKEKL